MAKSLSLTPIILLCCFSYLQAQPHECNRTCGNITFHYPFTISGRNCRGLPAFEINCSTVAKPPFFEKANTPYLRIRYPRFLEIVEFSYNNISVVSNMSFALPCSSNLTTFKMLGGQPFRISEKNMFVTVGCNTTGNAQLSKFKERYKFSLSPTCPYYTFPPRIPLPCKNNGCDYIPIPADFYRFYLSAEFLKPNGYQSCNDSGSAIVDEKSWESIQNSKSTNFLDKMYPISLVWAIPSSDNCSIIKKNSSYECAPEADCENLHIGYVCKCPEGYKGDGYINGTGCTASCAIKNSSSSNSYKCAEGAECKDENLEYVCKCPEGYKGDGHKNGTGCTVLAKDDECSSGVRCKFQTLSVITGACGAFLVALLGGGALLWAVKRRNLQLTRKRNYDRNGGAQLESLLSSRGVERTRVFTEDEIKKATNNFSQVLGTGGYGTVYKGILNDRTIVAVKKSTEMDSEEMDSKKLDSKKMHSKETDSKRIDSKETDSKKVDSQKMHSKETDSKKVDSKETDSKKIHSKGVSQFTNELVILSQINHRNVVKLLGCCLETPVPLLVYEFISNGNLYDHLHGGKYEDHPLHWEDRLRIASETAEALLYLHSAATPPIVHRDVKSSNILLDDVYNPKVSDFGVSRLAGMGETRVITMVQGTMGYLDPEYFQTAQLTEKSDVYSFGVVLLELLTGQQPVSYERVKDHSNLAAFFLSNLKSKDLIEIIDHRLKEEATRNMESMETVANLAKECLKVEGKERPTMKDVVQELLRTKNGERPHSGFDVDAAETEEMIP